MEDPNQDQTTPPRTQTDPTLHPNQQDPRTLLVPESAPEHHKTYHDDLPQTNEEEPPVQGLYPAPTSTEPENGAPNAEGSGSERWGESDWTAADGKGLNYPS